MAIKQMVLAGDNDSEAVFSGSIEFMKKHETMVKSFGLKLIKKNTDRDEGITEWRISGDGNDLARLSDYLSEKDKRGGNFGGMILE